MNADQAHPRSRGENRPRTDDWGNPSGSSPLTRGKPDRLQRREQAPGLIPAHAGKTPPRPRRSSHRRAHPRSRGENPPASLPGSGMGGSSPLTRGKHGLRQVPSLGDRLIPAHAGKTWVTSAASPTGRAHPRSRGENWSDRLYTSDTWGSSPLTRGKPARRGLEGMVRRLIPAHAGKTTSTTMIGTNPAAHPRSRGENPPAVAWKVWSGGSSPLTRGKQPSPPSLCTETRLIPAHAGKTPWQAGGRERAWAHPRSRGENARNGPLSVSPAGSSPLTRGKRRFR